MMVRVEMKWLDDESCPQQLLMHTRAESTVDAIVLSLQGLEDLPSVVRSLKIHAAEEPEVASGAVRLPRICVRVGDDDGAILVARVCRAMGHHGVSQEEIGAYCREARVDGYADALAVTQRWVFLR